MIYSTPPGLSDTDIVSVCAVSVYMHTEDSTKLSIQRLSHASSIMMAKNEDDLLEIGVLETSWSYVTGSRISSQLLDPEVLDRYEAAYVMIVGNLSERMQLDEIPDYIRLLLPKKKTVSNVNVGELLGKIGTHTNIHLAI